MLLDKGAAAQSLFDQKYAKSYPVSSHLPHAESFLFRCTLQKEEGGTDGGITPFYCLLVGNFSDEGTKSFFCFSLRLICIPLGQRAACANKLLSTNKVDIENKFGSDNSTALLVAQVDSDDTDRERRGIIETLSASLIYTSVSFPLCQLHGRNMIVQTLIAGRANLKATNTKGENVFHMWAR